MLLVGVVLAMLAVCPSFGQVSPEGQCCIYDTSALTDDVNSHTETSTCCMGRSVDRLANSRTAVCVPFNVSSCPLFHLFNLTASVAVGDCGTGCSPLAVATNCCWCVHAHTLHGHV